MIEVVAQILYGERDEPRNAFLPLWDRQTEARQNHFREKAQFILAALDDYYGKRALEMVDRYGDLEPAPDDPSLRDLLRTLSAVNARVPMEGVETDDLVAAGLLDVGRDGVGPFVRLTDKARELIRAAINQEEA
jgi:AcrR family transcriptional regulator